MHRHDKEIQGKASLKLTGSPHQSQQVLDPGAGVQSSPKCAISCTRRHLLSVANDSTALKDCNGAVIRMEVIPNAIWLVFTTLAIESSKGKGRRS